MRWTAKKKAAENNFESKTPVGDTHQAKPTMNILSLPSLFFLPVAGTAGTVASLHNNDEKLYLIFGFVLCLILIMSFFRYQRAKMWHETARLALEKGQPVPSQWDLPRMSGRMRHCGSWNFWNPWWEIRRGLVLLAVSGGLYLSLGERTHGWIAIPACIGAVYLLLGLLSLLRGDPKNPDDQRDPPAQP